ncbi:(S)-benzoin forming benzil reductase [Alteribacillus bidgolensis]|uniref:Benzil reductase ((S)-benzoin forming) n=1 Tax=Alteribacillus bidgolensis TaxID=930129 RepID=A0A1G8JEU9_9BACI|nr:(S)-benzoin forming benzil reductase [Alteribacillus bidgolensis]SDI29682.1 benzil reductase ((S)-benzoin forming) [Alteribacillus bidgolensis]
MDHIILTGASHGIGLAAAQHFLQNDNIHLYTISRSKDESLAEKARKTGASLDHFSCDLTDRHQMEAIVPVIFQNINQEAVSSLTLINNAGMVEPVAPADKWEPTDAEAAVQLNLLAPMILSSSFMKKSLSFDVLKTVLNVSSGAAQHPMHGWSVYCTTKAGLDMFTRTCALEQQENQAFPVRFLSFAPGIVDTPMQENIRSLSEEDFQAVETFQSYKDEGKLLSPESVAEKLDKLLFEQTFENGASIDIYEL